MEFKNSSNKIKFAELLGILLSDGWVYYKSSSRTYKIGVTNKSDFMHNKFKELCRDLFGVERFVDDKSQGGIRATFFRSKVAAMEILREVNSVKTENFRGCNGRCCFKCNPVTIKGKSYTKIKLPKFLFENKKAACAFLRALYSGDGSVLLGQRKGKTKPKIAREVALHCCHPILLEQLAKLMRSLDFRTFSVTDERISIFRKSEIKKFAKTVGFWPVEVTGFWEGKTKPQVLQMLVETCHETAPPQSVSPESR